MRTYALLVMTLIACHDPCGTRAPDPQSVGAEDVGAFDGDIDAGFSVVALGVLLTERCEIRGQLAQLVCITADEDERVCREPLLWSFVVSSADRLLTIDLYDFDIAFQWHISTESLRSFVELTEFEMANPEDGRTWCRFQWQPRQRPRRGVR